MNSPVSKMQVSYKRKRNFIAKELQENRAFKHRIHIDAKTKQKEKKWRLEDEEISSEETGEDLDF